MAVRLTPKRSPNSWPEWNLPSANSASKDTSAGSLRSALSTLAPEITPLVAPAQASKHFVTQSPGPLRQVIDCQLTIQNLDPSGRSMRGQLGNIKYRQIHRDPPNNASGMLSHDAHRLTAQQSIKTVRIAPRHHRQTGFWLDPGVGAITHRAPMAHFAHLPHWQVQLQYRLHKIRRQRISQQWLRVETVQERPGTHQIKVPLGSEKDTRGIGQAQPDIRKVHTQTIRRRFKSVQLFLVERVFRLVSTGQVTHHQADAAFLQISRLQ